MNIEDKDKKLEKGYHFYRNLLKPVWYLLYRPIIINKDYIPNEGACLIVGNHINNIDPCNVAASTDRTLHFLAKKELFTPWYGFFFRNSGCISVDCDNKSHSSTEEAIRLLKKGEAVCLFPEGRVNREHIVTLQPLKNGVIKMAKEANCKVIPFAIIGGYKPFKDRMKIVYGKPIDITQMSYEDANKTLYDIMYNLIIENS